MNHLLKAVFFGFILFFSSAYADIVDVWHFKSEQDEARATELVKMLRCPQCQNQNLLESNSIVAKEMREDIYQLVNDGKSNDEIIQIMTGRFGDFVLYKPRFNEKTAFLWLVPFVLLICVFLGLTIYIKRHKKRTSLTPQQQQLAQSLLKQQENRNK